MGTREGSPSQLTKKIHTAREASQCLLSRISLLCAIILSFSLGMETFTEVMLSPLYAMPVTVYM